MFSRRQMIAGIGKAICVGVTVPFIPSLLADEMTYSVQSNTGMTFFNNSPFPVRLGQSTASLSYSNSFVLCPGASFVFPSTQRIYTSSPIAKMPHDREFLEDPGPQLIINP